MLFPFYCESQELVFRHHFNKAIVNEPLLDLPSQFHLPALVDFKALTNFGGITRLGYPIDI